MSVCAIGVDLGGTKIALAALRGSDLGESLIATTELGSAAALIDQLVAMIERARPDGLQAVGIGVPSIVEPQTGRVVSSVNVPLADVPLGDVIGERLRVPVLVDNDANVAALAEAHDDQLHFVVRDLVMLTIGTGVGGGLVLGGRIYHGAGGGAGELGHTLVGLDLTASAPAPAPADSGSGSDLDSDLDAGSGSGSDLDFTTGSQAASFPQRGSLEWAASGHALDRLAADAAEGNPGSALGRLHSRGGVTLGADAVQAARDGDRAAIALVQTWARRVGIGVANAINTFDPQEVVIGGGAAQAGELLLGPVRSVAQGYVLPGLGTRTTIRLARHGVRAGVLGAALLCPHQLDNAPLATSKSEVHR